MVVQYVGVSTVSSLDRSLLSKPLLKEGLVGVSVATDVRDQLDRLKVLSDRYISRGYIDPAHAVQLRDIDPSAVIGDENVLLSALSPSQQAEYFGEGLLVQLREDTNLLYFDRWHFQSIPIVAKQQTGAVTECVGSARLILPKPSGLLPTLASPAITIDEAWVEKANDADAEFSQLATRKGSGSVVTTGLLRASYRVSKQLGIRTWIAVIDDVVLKLLNGNYFHFGLPVIGPGSMYLGSKSTPVLIDIDQALRNAASFESSRALAEFIKGSQPCGVFENYSGL